MYPTTLAGEPWATPTQVSQTSIYIYDEVDEKLPPSSLPLPPLSRQKPLRQKSTLDKAGPAGGTNIPDVTPPPPVPLSTLDGDDGYVAVAPSEGNGSGDNEASGGDNIGDGCDESLLRGGGRARG